MLPTERLLLDAVTVLASENINMKRILSENFPKCDFEELSAFDVDALVRNITIQKLTATDSMSVIMKKMADMAGQRSEAEHIRSVLSAPVDSFDEATKLANTVRDFYAGIEGVRHDEIAAHFGELSAEQYHERVAADTLGEVATAIFENGHQETPKKPYRVLLLRQPLSGEVSIQVQKQSGLLPFAVRKQALGAAMQSECVWVKIAEITSNRRSRAEFWGISYVEHLEEVVRTDVQQIWDRDFWFQLSLAVKDALGSYANAHYSEATKETFTELAEQNGALLATVTEVEVFRYREMVEQGHRVIGQDPTYVRYPTPNWEAAGIDETFITLTFRHRDDAVGVSFLGGAMYGNPTIRGLEKEPLLQRALWANAQRQLEGLIAYVKDQRDNTDVVVLE